MQLKLKSSCKNIENPKNYMKMQGKYTFLFVPYDATGHFQASIGIASVLRDRGHNVVFTITPTWKGKLSALGFGEEIYHVSDEQVASTDAPGAIWGESIAKMAALLLKPSIEYLENYFLSLNKQCLEQVKYFNSRMKEIVDTVKPDLILQDYTFPIPAISHSGRPWVTVMSLTPLGITNQNVPPAYSGYSAVEQDKCLWKTFEDKEESVFQELNADFNKWLIEVGGSPVKMRLPFYQGHSPYGNLYMYPKELDYTCFRPNPPKFHQFDCFLETPNETFEVPEKLKNGPGKLIYFSLGTIGSMDVKLMKKLIPILSKSPNRFLVSKGPLGDQLELGENMWGANCVPQTSILPLVDLVITHGGNNTVTESFYFGKRLLVLPIIFDQLDNGIRIQETGLGLQFHPYKVTEPELLEGIEKLLNDDLLERKMISISQRIQATKPQQKEADLAEKVASEGILKQG